MPTLATCTVIGHLYVAPEAITGQTRPGASFRFWTSDKPKKDSEKQFTSFHGTVWGPQAEWLLRDGKKGSLICVSGTFRLDSYQKNDGSTGHVIEIRANEARILDRQENGQRGAEPAPAPAPQRPVAAKPDDFEPPF